HRGIGALLCTEALANRAPPQRAVEREMVRIERLEAAAAAVAGEVLAVAIDAPGCLVARVVHVGDMHHPAAQLQGSLHRVGEAATLSLADDEAIDDDLDLVLAAMVD